MSIFENAFMIVIFRSASISGMPVGRAELSSGSDSAVGQRRLHGWAGLESAEHLHGGDGGAREFRRDVAGDASEAENLDVKRRPGIPRRLEILPRVVRQPELELPARHGLPDRVVLPFELVANGGADEVGAIGVEAVADHEINASEIDEAEVDRDFFAVGRLGSQLVNIAAIIALSISIRLDGLEMAFGWMTTRAWSKISRRRPLQSLGGSAMRDPKCVRSRPLGLHQLA